MKKPEWMTKKYWIFYFIFVPCFWIFYFGSNYYKKTHPKTPDMISALDIKEGDYKLLSEDNKACGFISILRINNNIKVDIQGDEINGSITENIKYSFKPIKFSSIILEPQTVNFETYYLYDSGNSYILLLKIRNENKYFINNYNKKTDNDLYMISNVSYEKFDYLLKYSDKMEIQKRIHASMDTNIYTCFFEQENIPKKKFMTFGK